MCDIDNFHMDKVVSFAQNENSEVWSPLSTGTLGASSAAKGGNEISPIDPSNSGTLALTDDFVRPTTPTRHFSSTPFILSASTSSPNLLVDKNTQPGFNKYRDSPKAKIPFQNASKLNDHIKVLQTQLSTSEHRQEALERENAELKQQVKMLQDHLSRQKSDFDMRMEDAVRVEEENAYLTRSVQELTAKISGLMVKLNEAEAGYAHLNSDMDAKLSKIESLEAELKACNTKKDEYSAIISQLSTDFDHHVEENKTLHQTVKLLEAELSQMRTRCQDKHDLMVAAERQCDILQEKLRQTERKLEELQETGLDDNMASGIGVAASSQMQLHLISQFDTLVKDQLESVISKKMSEFAHVFSNQSQVNSSQQFIPSAPPSIAGNDFDDLGSIKGDSVSTHGVPSSRSDVADPFGGVSLNAGDTTITSNNGSAGLGNIGAIISNPSSSTWKKPALPSSAHSQASMSSTDAKVLDWLPMDPEDEEMFEEEARWRDREFVKRTAIGAANRKRLIQQEESRPSFPPLPPVQQQENASERLTQLAERNRKQPMHMRSAYATEEAAFLIPENDLRTGKTMSIEGLAASTPLHPDQHGHQTHRMNPPLRVPKVPIASNRPQSMYAGAPQSQSKQPVTSAQQTPQQQPAPSSIPKPTQMIISPPNRSRAPTPKAESIANSSMSSSVAENKENSNKHELMIISPPARTVKGKTGIAKPVEAEAKKEAPKGGSVFIVSPPAKQQAIQKPAQAANANKTKSTSTPKKFLGAVARAFGSSSSKNVNPDQKTDL